MLLLMKPLVGCIVASLFCVQVGAAETEWVEVMPSVSLRLVSSDTLTDQGTVWLGIEIDMPEDTKTYWRVPGEAGIPLEIDAAKSHGVGTLDIAWPYPKRVVADGYLDHAYYGRVLIPFEAELTEPRPHFDADVLLGICSDVCVPVSVRLVLTLDLGIPDPANALRIRQARATVPLFEDAEAAFGEAVFDYERGVAIVARHPDAPDPESVIAEIDGALLVFDVPNPVGEGSALEFPLLGRFTAEMLEDVSLRLTYETAEGAFETVRPLR